jgi:hypothetical protein
MSEDLHRPQEPGLPQLTPELVALLKPSPMDPQTSTAQSMMGSFVATPSQL